MSTWVLLRGLARGSRHWEGFPALLKQALPAGSEVITLDLPGNGERARERSPVSVAAMVEAYREQLPERRGLHVLGLSLGAMAAIEWAARHPGELASAVVINGSAGGLSRIGERLRPASAWRLACSALHSRPVARERGIVSVCTNLADVEIAAQRWALHSAFGRTGGGNVVRQLLAAAAWRLPHVAPDVPILVLASAADRLVSAECSIAIARQWGLPIVLHPSAGHEIAMDDPAWLLRQCVRWCHGLVIDVTETTRNCNEPVIAAAQTRQNVPR